MFKIEEYKVSSKTIKGIIVDLDGTLLNSEPLHLAAVNQAIKELSRGTIGPLEVDNIFGRSQNSIYDQFLMPKIKSNTSIKFSIQEFNENYIQAFLYHIENYDLTTILNLKLIQYLKEKRKKCIQTALVTASIGPIAKVIINRAKLTDIFDFTVYSESVFLQKPNPSAYLLALRGLSLKTHEVEIYEDSPIGLLGASSLETNVFKVTLTRPK